MAVIKFLRDITGLFNWSTDVAPTSQQDYQNAVKNWQETEKNLVDAVLWQPETAYDAGNQVRTPSLPSECVLVCTTAGTSGANEPDYTSVAIGDTVADGTAEWTVASSLTGAGGAVTGSIVDNTNSADFIVNSVDSFYTEINGGTTYANGAWIRLNGKDNTGNEGHFQLRANDGVNNVSLVGKPDGTLIWNSKEVERINASGTNYIRYESGLQICWDTVTGVSSSGKNADFPVAFNGTPAITLGTTSASHCYYTGGSSTGFSAKSAGSNVTVIYIAAGKWK